MNLSVVIPTLNRYELLVQAVNSILKSDKKNLIKNIYIIDNGSEDKTQEIWRNSEKITLLRQKENLGIDGALALGISMTLETNAEALILTDDDSVFLDDTIEKLVESLLNYNNKKVINALPISITNRNGKLITPQKTSAGIIEYKKNLQDLYGRYRNTEKVHLNCSIISREILESTPLPNPLYFSGEETAYGEAIIKKGYEIVIDNHCHIYHPEIQISFIKLPIYGYFGVWNVPDWKTFYYVRNALVRRKKKSNFMIFLMKDMPTVALIYGIRLFFDSERLRKLPLYLKGYIAGLKNV